MKCPKCKFVSSNKKDLCPRCGLDLRPHKQIRGIPIQNTEASVQELRREVLANSARKRVVSGKKKTGKKKTNKKVRNKSTEKKATEKQPVEHQQAEKKQSWLGKFLGKSNTGEENAEALQSDVSIAARSEIQSQTDATETEIVVRENAELSAPEARAASGESAKIIPSSSTEPAVAIGAGGSASAEPAQSPVAAIDIDTFMSNLDEAPLSQFVDDVATDEELDDSPLPLEETETDVEPIESYAQSVEASTADAAEATSALVDAPFTEPEAETRVVPQVMEFGDSDESMEAELDRLIGDTVIDVESVKVEKKETYGNDEMDSAFMLGDDLEMEIEFEDDDEDIEISTSNADIDPESEEALLAGLIDAFNTIEQGTEAKSLAESSSNPAPQTPPTIPTLPENATEADKDKLIAELTSILAGGAAPAVTTDSSPSLPNLEQELEDELDALEAGPTATIDAAEEAEPASAIEEPEDTLDDLDALENELEAELAALSEEGLTVYSNHAAPAEAEEESTVSVAASEDCETEEEGLDEETLKQVTDSISNDLAVLEEMLAKEIDELGDEEAPSEIATLETHDVGMTGIFLQKDIERAMESALKGLNEQDSEEEQPLDEVEEAAPAARLQSATETGAFLTSDLEKVLAEAEAAVEEEPEDLEDLEQRVSPEAMMLGIAADAVNDDPDSEDQESVEELDEEFHVVLDEGLRGDLEEEFVEDSDDAEVIFGSAASEESEDDEALETLEDELDSELAALEEQGTSVFASAEAVVQDHQNEEIEPVGAEDAVVAEESEDSHSLIGGVSSISTSGSESFTDGLAAVSSSAPVIMPLSIDPALWDALDADLANYDPDDEIEMDLGELVDFDGSETVEVLFNVVREELENPDAGPLYQTEIPSYKDAEIDSLAVKSAFENFEKDEVVAAKRKVAAEEEAINILTEGLESAQINPAAMPLRAVAATIDFVAAAIFAVPLLAILSPIAYADLTNDWMLHFSNWIPYTKSLLATWIVYNVYHGGTSGQTWGQRACGLLVCDWFGGLIGFKQATLRSFSLLTTLLTFGGGLIPGLGKKRLTLHDRISHTTVTKLSDMFVEERGDGA